MIVQNIHDVSNLAFSHSIIEIYIKTKCWVIFIYAENMKYVHNSLYVVRVTITTWCENSAFSSHGIGRGVCYASPVIIKYTSYKGFHILAETNTLRSWLILCNVMRSALVVQTRTTKTPAFWDTPRRPMITHTSDSHQIPSRNNTKSKLQILENCQSFKWWNFARNFARDTPSEVAW